MRFDHYVITRFNIPTDFGPSLLYMGDGIRSERVITDETYLQQRFDLFEKTLWRCMRNQTCQDVIWLCFFYRHTPRRFLERIERYRSECEQFRPVFLDDSEAPRFKEIVQAEIQKGDADYVLSTRVDNDDLIRHDFIKRLQKTAQKAEAYADQGIFLTFESGLQYVEQLRILFRMNYRNNHFVSYLSAKGSDISVWTPMHTEIHKYGKVHCIRTAVPMWVEYCHTSNYINRTKYLFSNYFWDYGEMRRCAAEYRLETVPDRARYYGMLALRMAASPFVYAWRALKIARVLVLRLKK